MDEQFAYFDAYGIPRVNSEIVDVEPEIGSFAYLAQVIDEQGGVEVQQPLDVTQADAILESEFADYLFGRAKG